MSTPKIPPEIARRIAAMAKAAPAPAAPRAAAAPSPSAGGWAAKLAIIGWLLAAVAGAVAFAGYRWAVADKQAALAEMSAAYEAKLQQAKAEAEQRVQKTQADAAASAQVLKTELDFQKQPALPLKLVFRPGGVLYVESDAPEAFSCRVRVTRPATSLSKEFGFTINARTFRDMGAIEDWVFASGDRIEFFKPGYKPWTGAFP